MVNSPVFKLFWGHSYFFFFTKSFVIQWCLNMIWLLITSSLFACGFKKPIGNICELTKLQVPFLFDFMGCHPKKRYADNQIVFQQAVRNTTYSRNVLNVQNGQIVGSLSVQPYRRHAFKNKLVKASGRTGQRGRPYFFSWFQGIFTKSALDKKKHRVDQARLNLIAPDYLAACIF